MPNSQESLKHNLKELVDDCTNSSRSYSLCSIQTSALLYVCAGALGSLDPYTASMFNPVISASVSTDWEAEKTGSKARGSKSNTFQRWASCMPSVNILKERICMYCTSCWRLNQTAGVTVKKKRSDTMFYFPSFRLLNLLSIQSGWWHHLDYLITLSSLQRVRVVTWGRADWIRRGRWAVIGQGTGAGDDGRRGHARGFNDLKVQWGAVGQAVIGGGGQQGQVSAELQRCPLSICLRLGRVPPVLSTTTCRAVQLAVRVSVRFWRGTVK